MVDERDSEADRCPDPDQVARWILYRTRLARDRYGEMLRLICQLRKA